MKEAEHLIEAYRLTAHAEGGHFSEVYTAPFKQDGRALAGSIYFLLGPGEVSRLHEIDCDEIWYYHEGCGMKITALADGTKKEYLLGGDPGRGESAMVVIPAGCIFGAENLDSSGYTFVSCATVPKFSYGAFRLADDREIREKFGDLYEEVKHLL